MDSETFDPRNLDLSDVDTSKRIPLSDTEMRALVNHVEDVLDRVGVDRFLEFFIPLVASREASLRENHPDCAALRMLDEYRAREAGGFE